MKLNRIITLCAIAGALALSVGDIFAQDNGGGNGGNGGGQGGQGGGQRRNRQGGGPGGGNFDPAQFQQRMMDNIREQLNFTNDTDWSAVQPLVQKVMDARRDVGGAGMRGCLAAAIVAAITTAVANNNGGDRGGMFGTAQPGTGSVAKSARRRRPGGADQGFARQIQNFAASQTGQARSRARRAQRRFDLETRGAGLSARLGVNKHSQIES